MQKSIFLGLTTLLAFSAAARSADAPDTIVVTANRTEQPLARVGQSISVIDAKNLATRQIETVADVLRTVPGVTISRYGGIGSLTSVFIRGAESDQTVALIDGIKLNDPSAPGGGFDFGNLLAGNIARIEVLRGAQSVLWGSQAIGGVVNVITVLPSDTPHANARAEYGYRNTAQFVGNVSGKAGPLSASAGAGYLRTDGISAFSEARGGREKDGYRNYGANANVNLALSDTISLDLRGWYSHGHVGLDGYPPPDYVFADTRESAITREVVGYAGLNAALFDGRFHNRFGYAITDTRRRNYNPDNAPVETFAGDGRNERIEYQGVVDLADRWQATFGAEHETTHYTTASPFGPTTSGRVSIDSGYGQLVATPFAGFTATGGVRYDHHSRFGGNTSFSASGVYTPNANATTVRASYSEGFKAPSLFQLQSEYGNQLLRPERSRGWDAGVTQRLVGDTLEASATYFRRDSRDLINYIYCSAPLIGICTNRPNGTYDNVARARAEGVELTLKLQPIKAFTVQANYTYLKAEDRSPDSPNLGRQLARRPQHSANVLVDYRWTFGLETGATLTHVGASFDDAGNSQRLPGYVLADLRAAIPIGHHIDVTARLENLLNERYETAYQFGSPGRAGYIDARLHY